MSKIEVYFSGDVEADGPIPGPHSMLSFGFSAYTNTGNPLGTFERNLELLPGAAPHPKTLKFWEANKAAYAETRVNPIDPKQAMYEFRDWINQMCKRVDVGALPVMAAYPAGFDFTFIHWYFHRFTDENPFSHSCYDIKTAAAVLLGVPYRSVSKGLLKKHWPSAVMHNHVALTDALEQGDILVGIQRQIRNRSASKSGKSRN